MADLHQVARGGVGPCCQKVGEAEAMTYDGIRDGLVSYDGYVGVRGGRVVEALWPLAARGAVR